MNMSCTERNSKVSMLGVASLDAMPVSLEIGVEY